MKKSITRNISLLLSVLTLCSAMYSCSDTTNEESESESTADTSIPANPAEESVDEEEYSILSTLPEYDFEGKTVTALTKNEIWWQITDLDAEEITGEPINDALFNRNLAFNAKYNATFDVVYEQGALIGTIRNAVSSGDTAYDIVVPNLDDASNMVNGDLLINLNRIESIDFTNEAWDQHGVEFYSIARKLYYGISDISLGKNEAAWIYMFNKKLLADYGLENPYDLVREGRWTFDKSLEFMTAASSDANGNGVADKGDRFGLATHDANYYALLIAAGQSLAVKDEAEDIPVMNVENEAFLAVYDKLKDSFTDESQTVMEWQGETFTEGNALLCAQVLACVRLFREMEDDFGIIPCPKFDENQSGYHTYVIPYDVFASCIPVSAANPEESGTAIQALAIYSAHYLTPAYYDITITGKGLRDEDSAEMLDIILDGAVYDIARMYNWGSFPSAIPSMIAGKKDLTSSYQKSAKVIDKTLNKTVETIRNNLN